MSAPPSVIESAASSAVVRLCAVADGASLTAVTAMLIVAAVETALPSLAVKLKLSGPL